MVPVLVRDHVGLRERAALRAEARAELVEEPEVDVDVLVGGAVERAHRRGGEAAAALHGLREEARAGGHVLAAAARERVRPVALDRVDVADDPAVLALVGVGARAAVLGELAVVRRRGPRRLAGEVPELAEAAVAAGDVAAEEDDQQRDDEADPAAADGEPALADARRPRRSSTWEVSSLASSRKSGIGGLSPPRRRRCRS